MRILIPEEHGLSTEAEREAYRIGFRDAVSSLASKAGQTKSCAKAAAARANGAKGGRPRKKGVEVA